MGCGQFPFRKVANLYAGTGSGFLDYLKQPREIGAFNFSFKIDEKLDAGELLSESSIPIFSGEPMVC